MVLFFNDSKECKIWHTVFTIAKEMKVQNFAGSIFDFTLDVNQFKATVLATATLISHQRNPSHKATYLTKWEEKFESYLSPTISF